LLLLTFLHTLPVVWITPVAAGTAPTAALLAYGIASVLTLDHEGIALGLMALVPALAYTGIAWVLAWLLGKMLRWGRPAVSAWLLGCLTMGLLLAVYFPIYIAGGHNSSSSSDLIGLFDNTLSQRFLLSYWIALHAVLSALFAGSLLSKNHAFIAPIERWAQPVLRTVGIAMLGTILSLNYDLFLCRPLAELGVARAQVCVARTAGREQRYWYERAAAQGDGEAISWLIDKTPNRKTRLTWLRKGAEEGDPAIQFALYQWLLRAPGADAKAEAERWLLLAAEGDSADAQMALVERLSRSLYRTHSTDQLAKRSAWLERAAKLGSRTAKLHLAQHYSAGSMGYAVDFGRARAYYRELIVVDQLTKYERARQLDAAGYERRLNELDAWEAGLESRDPDVMKAMAKRYLASQFPGPGVRELGTQLMEQLARDGDEAARDELIVMLRTGSGGVEKNLDAAKRWLLNAAEAGDPDAMERLAQNYMSGREGFAVDYPEARRWIEALIARDHASNESEAQARVESLRNDLKYIDRMGKRAGGTMLGSSDLDRLGERTDANSQYQHAIQLLAGHGSKRRAEAISQLEKAAQKGHGEAAWRLFEIYERGFPKEIDQPAALRMLKLAVANHHFDATRKLAMSYEYGKRGIAVDLPRAIELYEGALEAGHDNRYGWNLDPKVFNHYRWLESRLRQARLKLDAETRGSVARR
jgi:TPR repeat protein